MLIPIKIAYLHKIDPTKDNDKNRFGEWIRWHNDEEIVNIPSHKLTKSDIDKLQEFGEKDSKENIKGANLLLRRLKLLHDLNKDSKGMKLKSIENTADAIYKAMKPLPHKWLFQDEGGFSLPYFVHSIEYVPATCGRNGRPAHVNINMCYIDRGDKENKTLTLYQGDLKDRTVSEILDAQGYYMETEEAYNNYVKEIEFYKEYSIMPGVQFLASGFAQLLNDRWSSGVISMVRDGVQTRVIMDDLFDEEEGRNRSIKSSEVSNTWGKMNLSGDDDDDDDDQEATEETIVPPSHPFVKIFDLTKHQYAIIHISNLSLYEYNKDIFDKLILPKDRKDLIDILVQGSGMVIEDIVKGKTGGIIVLATGEPGTGKTLTAEVYSEQVGKSLYVVQCSQLGTDEEELEKQLTSVLSRSSRWGAILLIDEADVYIHRRGDDLQQNAIVGVFLRVLEYYKGILFLTSNRETIIDDAILSRLTAHIRYSLPTKEDLGKIWKILSDQFKIELGSSVINKVVEEFPSISGRTIKNILKLSKLLAERRKTKVDFEIIKYASTFIDYTKKNVEEM